MPSGLAIFKKFYSTKKLSIHVALIMLLFAVALMLRLDTFLTMNAQENSRDYARDYLIAHHIVEYKEFPLRGPEGLFGPHTNSPAYYYFLSLFLLIHDDPVFLGLINVFLQALSVLIVFVLGYTLFNFSTGYGTALIFAVLDFSLAQSIDVWQPHFMQSFILASFLCLALGINKKSYGFLCCSCVLFVFAFTLHPAVITIAPLFLLIIFGWLWYTKADIQHYGRIGLYLLGSAIIFFIPLWMYTFVNPSRVNSFAYMQQAMNFSLYDTSANAIYNFLNFISLALHVPYFFAGFLIGTILALSAWYLTIQENTQKRFALLALICALGVNALGVGLLQMDSGVIPSRYYIPTYALLLLLIVELIFFYFAKLKVIWFGWIIIALFVYMQAGAHFLQVPLLWSRLSNFEFQKLDGPVRVADDLPHLLPTIELLRKETKRLQSFTYQNFGGDGLPSLNAPLLWVALELHYKAPFVRIDDTDYFGYTALGDDERIIVRCYALSNDECKIAFNKHNTKEYVLSEIYQSSDSRYFLARMSR